MLAVLSCLHQGRLLKKEVPNGFNESLNVLGLLSKYYLLAYTKQVVPTKFGTRSLHLHHPRAFNKTRGSVRNGR